MSVDATPPVGTGDAAWPGPAFETLGQGLRRSFKGPPGVLFHVGVAVPTLTYLWSHSYPGLNWELDALSSLALALVALIWMARLVTFWWARKRGHSASRSARWFIVAPVAGALVAALGWAQLPLRTRWSFAQHAFEQQIPAALADPNYVDDSPRRLGSYTITVVRRNHDAVFFYEAHGAFLDYAGFAYLPRGPQPEYENGSFETPSWFHLGDRWYAWAASW